MRSDSVRIVPTKRFGFPRAHFFFGPILQHHSYDSNNIRRLLLQILQLLTYQLNTSVNKRWVLKCPLHLFFLREIVEVFPDAKIVWAHRHPVPCIASACSLLKAFHELYYEGDTCDTTLLGQKVAESAHQLVSECPAIIREIGCDAAHVNYANLIDDPVETIRMVCACICVFLFLCCAVPNFVQIFIISQIYSQFNWDFTEEYHKVLLEFLKTDAVKRNATKKKNQNKILHNTSAANTLRNFGLNEQLVLEKFQTYIKDFGLLKMK